LSRIRRAFGASQRRERPCPTARTAADSSSWRSARWTVRWLEPSAQASAEVDHDSPPSRSAMIDPASPSIGGASTTTLAASTGASAKPRGVASMRTTARSAARKRLSSTRSRARCDSFGARVLKACSIRRSRGTSMGHASASAAASAKRIGRLSRATGALRAAHHPAAGVHDEIARCEQLLDLVEAHRTSHAAAHEACRRSGQRAPCTIDLGDESGNVGGDRGGVRAPERGCASLARTRRRASSARVSSVRATSGAGSAAFAASTDASVSRPHRARPPGAAGAPRRAGRAPRSRDRRACRARGGRFERIHLPAQVARGERDLGLGDLAARLREPLARPEATRRSPEELSRPSVFAELRHRDAA
jgi:hypothetical protein